MDPAPLKPPPDIRLEQVLQQVGDAITVQAPDGRLVFVNEAAAALLGFDGPAEVLEAPVASVMDRFDLLDEDGAPLDLAELPGRRAMAGEAHAESVVRFRHRTDVIDRWSLVRATRIERDGALAYVVSAFQDITAMKQREIELALLAQAGEVLGRSTEYQETLADLARLMVPVLADWCVVDVFEADGLRRVGIAHVDADRVALAEEVQRRYPPDPESGATRVAVTGEPLLITEVSDEMIAAGARDAEHLRMLQELDIRSVLAVPLAARGSVLGAMTLIRSAASRRYDEGDLPLVTDIARRAAIAVDNARLLHESTDALRMRDEFLATASHDMRTPLATVLGYLQLAQRHVAAIPEAGRLPEYLARAERTAVRLARLVAELMDVSLIRNGQPLPLALTEVDLGELVRHAASEHQLLSGTHDITVQAPAEPIPTVTDESRIQRILDNLLGNAIKYSEDGTRIVVAAVVDGDSACITVTDQGVGIPADELATVFERFHRASTGRAAPGVGLGLAGSREVARQLGGDVSAESEPGIGSTFTVRIPMSPPPAVREQAE